MTTRAGFVALIGEPNAGKSTLLNRMVGAKVSIVTHKVQTTRTRIRGLQSRARQLESQVSVDFKTGLTSELYMKKIMGLEWKRAQRHQNPLSLLLIDVDNFKSVNDTTEYAFGDEVLRRVADALKGNVRETDFAARFGGDEFCVLFFPIKIV